MLSNICGLKSPDASSTPCPSGDSPKCLLTLSDVLRGLVAGSKNAHCDLDKERLWVKGASSLPSPKFQESHTWGHLGLTHLLFLTSVTVGGHNVHTVPNHRKEGSGGGGRRFLGEGGAGRWGFAHLSSEFL